MPKTKVLQLEFWMTNLDEEELLECCKEIPPKFNRDGYYCEVNNAWFEIDGKAYSTLAESFHYTLDLLEAEKLNARQVEALQQIFDQKLATKSQRKKLYFARQIEYLKDLNRSVVKQRNAIFNNQL